MLPLIDEYRFMYVLKSTYKSYLWCFTVRTYKSYLWCFTVFYCTIEQDAQLSQRDRAVGCVIVFAKSRRLELGDNSLRTV